MAGCPLIELRHHGSKPIRVRQLVTLAQRAAPLRSPAPPGSVLLRAEFHRRVCTAASDLRQPAGLPAGCGSRQDFASLALVPTVAQPSCDRTVRRRTRACGRSSSVLPATSYAAMIAGFNASTGLRFADERTPSARFIGAGTGRRLGQGAGRGSDQRRAPSVLDGVPGVQASPQPPLPGSSPHSPAIGTRRIDAGSAERLRYVGLTEI